MSGEPGLFELLQQRVDAIEKESGTQSFSPVDLLDLAADERLVVQVVMKSQPIAASSVAGLLALDLPTLSVLVDRLVARGALVVASDGLRVGTWAARRRSPGGLWDRLGDLGAL